VNYFSDGGTTSNFPIHFFDSWLPSRPTFGINLTSMPSDAIKKGETRLQKNYLSALIDFNGDLDSHQKEDEEEQTAEGGSVDAVVLPRSDTKQAPEWRPICNPLDFVMKTIDTARENHDNLQTMLPGYRERIVQVRFNEGEGGMNLAMDSSTISTIALKGKMAGEQLRYKFDFDHHRWTRFLVLMSQLEKELEKMGKTFIYQPGVGKDPDYLSYEQLLAHDALDPDSNRRSEFPYKRDHEWRMQALMRTRQMLRVIELWEEEPDPIHDHDHDDQQEPMQHFFGTKCEPRHYHNRRFKEYECPQSEPVLRVTPGL
jgi:hypothetical protein